MNDDFILIIMLYIFNFNSIFLKFITTFWTICHIFPLIRINCKYYCFYKLFSFLFEKYWIGFLSLIVVILILFIKKITKTLNNVVWKNHEKPHLGWSAKYYYRLKNLIKSPVYPKIILDRCLAVILKNYREYKKVFKLF